MPINPRSRTTGLSGTLAAIALVASGVVVWSFAASAESLTAQLGLFTVAATAILVVLRRHLPAGLVVIGVMSLGMPGSLQVSNGWALLFLASTIAGSFLWLRPRPALRWVAISIPLWVYANQNGLMMTAAVSSCIAGMAQAAVGPTLPARRRRHPGAPLAHLQSGPVGTVHAMTIPSANRNRLLLWVAATFAATALCAGIAAALTRSIGSTTLALTSTIIGATSAFSHWFTGRVRLRIDAGGVHGRTMWREYSIPWSDVSELGLRYLFFPGSGIRMVYYCVRSPTTEISFPSSMPGADRFRAAIENATGERWLAPEIEPTF